MTDVSVIIPVYGDHPYKATLEKVTALWLRQSVPCEVIVAVAGTAGIPVAQGAKVIRGDFPRPGPGILRNFGARHARSPWLYMTDRDVAPVGDDYLARALKLAAGRTLAQPWMHRVEHLGFDQDVLSRPRPADPPYCYAVIDADGRLEPMGGEEIVWTEMDLENARLRVPGVKRPPRMKEIFGDGQPIQPAFAWGGLLLPNEVFFDLGGYCERYVGWGGEDDDMLVKVAGDGTVRRAWDLDRSLVCVHVEHTHPHRRTDAYAANRALLKERRAMGHRRMIEEDGKR
ncbi:galactosyltransferase-related protein [Streptosporangium sandarakinum]|uniref:galactosyltransferase-related protein n=1 Tax=Streptosporangium sandarakinum TaxID=1260955 RepID=UPI003415EB78